MRRNRRRHRRYNTTIRGVVALAEWSDSKDDAEVVLLTDDDEEYYIDASDSTIRPSKYINSRVEASGKVYEMDERKVLLVRRIRVVESFQGFEDQMYDDAEEDDFADDRTYDFFLDDAVIDDYARFLKGQRDFGD